MPDALLVPLTVHPTTPQSLVPSRYGPPSAGREWEASASRDRHEAPTRANRVERVELATGTLESATEDCSLLYMAFFDVLERKAGREGGRERSREASRERGWEEMALLPRSGASWPRSSAGWEASWVLRELLPRGGPRGEGPRSSTGRKAREEWQGESCGEEEG